MAKGIPSLERKDLNRAGSFLCSFFTNIDAHFTHHSSHYVQVGICGNVVVEINTYRHTLLYFHEIARRVVHRKERITRTCGRAYCCHRTTETGIRYSINADFHRLTYAYARKLCLPEVGHNPLSRVGNECRYGLSRCNELPFLHCPTTDASVCRSRDNSIGKVEPRHIDRCLGTHHGSPGILPALAHLTYSRECCLTLLLKSCYFRLSHIEFCSILLHQDWCGCFLLKQFCMTVIVALQFFHSQFCLTY